MYTINDIRKILGLSTANQVRNRIEAVKELLAGEIRRGPNNQILLTDAGLGILKRLQDLYDSGLTITQASEVLQANTDFKNSNTFGDSPGLIQNRAKQSGNDALIQALKDEIAFLRTRVAYLEAQLHKRAEKSEEPSWWEHLREEIDGA